MPRTDRDQLTPRQGRSLYDDERQLLARLVGRVDPDTGPTELTSVECGVVVRALERLSTMRLRALRRLIEKAAREAQLEAELSEVLAEEAERHAA